MPDPHLAKLTPSPVGRPWGGGRFGHVDGEPVGELWVTGDEATLPDGRTLVEAGLASSVPLVKVLDIAGRLSVQVHPDDRLARELAGPAGVGKHEAWVVLDVTPGATIDAGLAPGASLDDLFSRDGERILSAIVRRPATTGSVIDVPPGAVHAPGAGLVLYEVQQRSDLTYRIWDWGRPRPVHLAEARRALRAIDVGMRGPAPSGPGRYALAARIAPFTLDLCRLAGEHLELDLAATAVLSVVAGTLAVGGRSLPTGSHWLVGTGRTVLTGRGDGLLAAWS